MWWANEQIADLITSMCYVLVPLGVEILTRRKGQKSHGVKVLIFGDQPRSLRQWWQKVANRQHGGSSARRGLICALDSWLIPALWGPLSVLQSTPALSTGNSGWAIHVLHHHCLVLIASLALALLDWFPFCFWPCSCTSPGVNLSSLPLALGAPGVASLILMLLFGPASAFFSWVWPGVRWRQAWLRLSCRLKQYPGPLSSILEGQCLYAAAFLCSSALSPYPAPLAIFWYVYNRPRHTSGHWIRSFSLHSLLSKRLSLLPVPKLETWESLLASPTPFSSFAYNGSPFLSWGFTFLGFSYSWSIMLQNIKWKIQWQKN